MWRALKCWFNYHNLEIRTSELPWQALYKRERCVSCSYVKYYVLGNAGWNSYPNPQVCFELESVWVKEVIGVDNTGDLEFLKDLIIEGICRVKHLDKEDIESLGFETMCFGGYSDDIPIFPISFNRTVNRQVKSEEVLAKRVAEYMRGERGIAEEYYVITRFKWGTIIVKLTYFGDRSFNLENVFKGTIKNKSELKRILKQLSV